MRLGPGFQPHPDERVAPPVPDGVAQDVVHHAHDPRRFHTGDEGSGQARGVDRLMGASGGSGMKSDRLPQDRTQVHVLPPATGFGAIPAAGHDVVDQRIEPVQVAQGHVQESFLIASEGTRLPGQQKVEAALQRGQGRSQVVGQRPGITA